MIRSLQFVIFACFLLSSARIVGQDSNSVALHIKVYDRGVCIPMVVANSYSTSRFREVKSVLQSSGYYSTLYAFVNSADSADLRPETNHELQSSALHFNPNLDYELVLLRGDGFNNTAPDSMVIKISKLRQNAQVALSFEQGKFKLQKMEHFKKLNGDTLPNFKTSVLEAPKMSLKLDSTAFFENSNPKAKYYIVSDNFPLYFVQEFDAIDTNSFAQGYRLLSGYGMPPSPQILSAWANADATKYGYWEYFENGLRTKHEFCASIVQQQFEWYPNGQLKSAIHYGQANKRTKYTRYLQNGSIIEEYSAGSRTSLPLLKCYAYSPAGKIVLCNTYNSKNGLTTQGLHARQVFYPSGQLKIEENFAGVYTIKHYKEDGTIQEK